MKITVILPAAGQSKRFDAAGKSKLEVEIEGVAVFLRAVRLFENRPDVREILVAVNPDKIDEFRFKWGDQLGLRGIRIVAGGKVERWETVNNALKEVSDDTTHVAIHDAARPLTSRKLINRVFDAATRYPAVIPGLPVSATLKRVVDLQDDEKKEKVDPLDAILGSAGKDTTPVRRVEKTVDRTDMIEVQTPQVFEIELLRKAYAQLGIGQVDPATITDDAGLIESLGLPVYVVEGEPTNLKITRPGDLELARGIASLNKGKEAASLAKKRLFGDDDDD